MTDITEILLHKPKLSILTEIPSLSYGNSKENMIINGENLEALKILEEKYSNSIQCIYIDPPYNTGKSFEHYDDKISHINWLNFMKERLVILRHLLKPTGFICCQIDDKEGPYLKVLMDEIFGISNYLCTLYIKTRHSKKILKQSGYFHKEIEQIHIYQKSDSAIPILSKKYNSLEKFNYYINELSPVKKYFLVVNVFFYLKSMNGKLKRVFLLVWV